MHTGGMRILVVEDDPSVSAALAAALTRAGHRCDRVSRGADVLEQHPAADAVMLDLGLEDMDGLEALRRLREVSPVPVIVVTARGDERSTVHALRLGADDYLVKPVRLHELLARLAAVTRRYVRAAPERLEVGGIVVDAAAHRVTQDGAEIPLTPTEFALLTELAREAGTVVDRRNLLDRVWGDGYASTSRAFDVHLAQLRQKLPMLTITTIRGIGFRLEARE